MLTRKQYELLRFISERLKESGVPPSFDEMKDALDLRSKSGIHRLITALEERGFIRRLPNRARALEVVRMPESAIPAQSGGPQRGFRPNVIEGTLGKVRTDQSSFRVKNEPGNPAADANGNVKYPNVDPLIEMTDMREAQRSYEANLNIISATRRMIQRTLDILKA